jgi:hypothetical protein
LRYIKGISGGTGVGLVVLLSLPFLQPTYCPDHGKIPLSEFSGDDQRRIRRRTTIQFLLTIVLLLAAIILLAVVLRG